MYACKQPWLDYNLFFCPDAKPDDGKLWLVIMNDNWSHYWGAYWMLNADRVGIYTHIYTHIYKYLYLIRFSPPTWSAREPPWSPCPPSGIDILHLFVFYSIVSTPCMSRFVPAQPARAVMTVDAERLEGGAVQGAVRRSRVNLMVNT